MAELASSMAGMLLPNHFQPLDHDSESDNDSIEYGSSVQIPFSSMSETSDTSSRPEIKSSSPNVTVEYLPHLDLKDRTEDSWSRMDSSNLTNDSGFTPNSSGFSADLSSSGGFSSSCDLSFNSKNSSLNCGESFRTQPLGTFSFDEQAGSGQPVTPTKLADANEVPNDDPLTPTANLKMLLSAMSPEIRNMENKKKKARLFDAMVEAASQGTILPSAQGTMSCTDLGTESSSTLEAMSTSTLGTVSPCNQETVMTSSEDVSILNTSSGHDSSFLLSPTDEHGTEEGEKNNRKSKSLGLLCQKFLTKYPDYPPDGKAMDISLDQISKDLNVERRRIYDIVNVLESVEMVSRRAKNRYLWHGRTHLYQTLAKLKCLGQRQKFAEQLALLHSRLEDGSLSMDDTKSPVYGPDRMAMSDVAKQPLQDIGNFLKSPVETEMRKDGREHWEDDTKRDKTLGVMSQKFIMLFLVCKDRIISLDVAARILKGDQNYQIGENAKFKTKVRRLYDIANILTSLKLIDKIHLSEGRSRKPAFRWIGPDPDTSHVDWSELPTGKKPTQKHSYFPLPPVNSSSWSSNPTHKQTPAMVKLPLGKTTPLKSRIIWSRNASFSAMCEVAEQEHRKCSSAPNSPVKDEVDKENSSTSTLNNGSKKEEEFIQEFQALRNKYPACVSRLFSGSTVTSSDPSPLTSDAAPLTPESFHRRLSPRDGSQVTTVRIASPRSQGDGECTSASKTKSQKLVYVQRFVPLLNANTIAAVQASSTHQTNAGNPTITTGNRTIVTPNSNSPLVSGPHPAVISPTPGSVIHLLPMRQDNWVKLPNGGEAVSKSGIGNGQHSTTNSVASPEAAETQVKCPVTSNSNQVVTIIRRSKRAVKLALDKEFEYHPLIKKVKSGDKVTGTTIQNPPTKATISEPTKNSTVIITHPTHPVSIPEGPHPQAHTPVSHPQKKAGQEETGNTVC
ncbi:uncharacterized protein LOC121405700 [Lytechinus variegatus]|uniref:uncharacterized protein LOC121405700 n=1 Tax=Lytechinus variegatus TaxID=7654 RepID=UPI001BB1DFB6|nr:uncharacterized protein LOC121405700 [Lytechinus variegatus]